jgi:hypothetical protein
MGTAQKRICTPTDDENEGNFGKKKRQHFRSDFLEKRGELIQILGPRVWDEERRKIRCP